MIKNTSGTRGTDTSRYLTRNEAAEMAGVNWRTIDRWRSKGLLTTHKLRHLILIDPEELKELMRIEAQPKKTVKATTEKNEGSR